MRVTRLNLDPSLAVSDPYYSGPAAAAGVVRFMDASDALRLPVFNRLSSDLVYRDRLIEAKVNEIIDELSRLAITDTSSFVSRDGSSGFTGVVSGIRPVEPEHLATKEYVDDGLSDLSAAISSVSEEVANINQTTVHTSDWTQHTWSAGAKQILSFLVDPVISDPDQIVSISLMEKVNVSIPTVGNPSPEPRWVYRSLPLLAATIDDLWFEGGVVSVAFPNSAFYTSGYGSAHEDTRAVYERYLKAVVTVLK